MGYLELGGGERSCAGWQSVLRTYMHVGFSPTSNTAGIIIRTSIQC